MTVAGFGSLLSGEGPGPSGQAHISEGVYGMARWLGVVRLLWRVCAAGHLPCTGVCAWPVAWH